MQPPWILLPMASIFSVMPTDSRISSVRGLTASARELSGGCEAESMILAVTPCPAENTAAANPTGPAPTIKGRDSGIHPTVADSGNAKQ
jgi:hypothetical protein